MFKIGYNLPAISDAKGVTLLIAVGAGNAGTYG
jgi:hypothetical protein